MLQHSSFTSSKVSTSLFHHSKLYLDTRPKFLATFLAKNIPPCMGCFSRATEQSLCCQNYVRWWTGCSLTQLYHCSTGYVFKRSMLNFSLSKFEGREKRSVIYVHMPSVFNIVKGGWSPPAKTWYSTDISFHSCVCTHAYIYVCTYVHLCHIAWVDPKALAMHCTLNKAQLGGPTYTSK